MMTRLAIGIEKMDTHRRIALNMAIILCITSFAAASIDAAKWTHFTIADPLPGSAWGTGGIPLADFDSDGYNDVVIPGYWFANPGNNEGNWQKHPWPHLAVKNASYGTSMRCWVDDIDLDGSNDIIYSDCDTGHSHVYWVENTGEGKTWQRHQLADPPTAEGDVPGTGSFHSLGVADFDRDGDLDIFAGEQEDPDTYMEAQGKIAMKPRGLKERGVIWENSGTKIPSFLPVVIHVDNPGWHDAVLADIDGDGDTDIITKVWNKDGKTYHADYWRNDNN